MQKILLSLLLLSATILAEVTNVEINRDYIEKSKIKIIDIRTESEWEKMGVIKGAYLITFFPEVGECNPKLFMQELKRVVDKDEQFALISNTASRSKLVSNFLGKKNNYKVVNLIGGMKKLIKEGYEVELYNPCKKRESVEKSREVEVKFALKQKLVAKKVQKEEKIKRSEKLKREEKVQKAEKVKKEELLKKDKVAKKCKPIEPKESNNTKA